ncbi:hypothetical protein ABEB36_008186 [Hypothenemus hampei]|uniref:Uncharacterized protein n=1 Tax=Hypothenemus hampei TaxID=57062 RepID=A0ABD1ELM7_HYPHA
MTGIILYLKLFVTMTMAYPLNNQPLSYFYPYLDHYYGSRIQPFYIPPYAVPYRTPTMNFFTEIPYAVSKEFSIMPMFIMSKDTLNMVSQGQITTINPDNTVQTIKLKANNSIECTPAIRMVLENPIIAGSLKSDVLFPSEVQILHQGVRVPIRIGAVIAPILPQTYVSEESPISIKVVYAIPKQPIKITITIEPVNGNENEIPQDGVVVESDPNLPPKNITITDFPSNEAEPHIEVDEDDDELVNRNPPVPLLPAGIVQSTQPINHEQPFHNDKESPLLEIFRDPTKKKRI